MGFNQKINDAMNNASRQVTTEMMKNAPTDLKYVYIGPVDEKTRPFCLDAASQGALTEAQILALGGEYAESLVSGGGINCRHNWELASDDIQKQFHRGGEAQKIIEAKKIISKTKKITPVLIKPFTPKAKRIRSVEELIKDGYTESQAKLIFRNVEEMMDMKSPDVNYVLNNINKYERVGGDKFKIYRVVPKNGIIEEGDFVFNSLKGAENFRKDYGFIRGQPEIVEKIVSGKDLLKHKKFNESSRYGNEFIYLPKSMGLK